MKAFFDGGCQQGVGSGGFVIYDEQGKQLGGKALYFGPEASTNNLAEIKALKSLVSWLAEYSAELGPCPNIEVFGDSELVINFLLRFAKPNKPHLREVY